MLTINTLINERLLSQIDSDCQCAMGLNAQSLLEIDDAGTSFYIHRDMRRDFEKLKARMAEAGFDLGLVSTYRSFERQLAIFSAKAAGKRKVLDDLGRPVDRSQMSDLHFLHAILRWSALPGLSRHHFGSDIDIFDARAMSRESVALLPEEVEQGGPCAAMHDYLDELIADNNSFGFYRPYQQDTGGIAVERWHLSYAPIASQYEASINIESLVAIWDAVQLPLLDVVLDQLDLLLERYVVVSPLNKPTWLVS